MQFYSPKPSAAEERNYKVRLLGVDGANPTKELGQGITASRTGEGAYRLVFATNPGTFVGWSCNFGAATPADLKGYTAVRDTWDATNLRLDFVIYDSTFTAADIIANQYADVVVTFKETSA